MTIQMFWKKGFRTDFNTSQGWNLENRFHENLLFSSFKRTNFCDLPFLSPKFCVPLPNSRSPLCGNTWHFLYFWLMLSVSSSLHLSVTLDKENSVGQKGQVRPWIGACRTAQIREPIWEVWQIVIIIVVREWGHLFINLPFIYLFIYSESTTYLKWSEMFGRIKFPEFSLRL